MQLHTGIEILHSSFKLVKVVPSFWCWFRCFLVLSILFACLIIIYVPNLCCVGILHLIQRETHSRLLASLFKILTLLVASTPYDSSPPFDHVFVKICFYCTRYTASHLVHFGAQLIAKPHTCKTYVIANPYQNVACLIQNATYLLDLDILLEHGFHLPIMIQWKCCFAFRMLLQFIIWNISYKKE